MGSCSLSGQMDRLFLYTVAVMQYKHLLPQLLLAHLSFITPHLRSPPAGLQNRPLPPSVVTRRRTVTQRAGFMGADEAFSGLEVAGLIPDVSSSDGDGFKASTPRRGGLKSTD